MIFRQLFEPQSCTFTYLIACPGSRRAVLVDPVLETFERDLDVMKEMGLTLAYTLETHIHADHLTSALKLKAITGSRIAAPARIGMECIDVPINEGHSLGVGAVRLEPLYTPGHTDHHHCYRLNGPDWQAVLTGDCLLIDGCGRTDFQGGDAEAQFRSVRDVLFQLPDETLVYPGHDYQGRRVSSIAQEKARNPRLGDGRTLGEFEGIMAELELPYPKKLDLAVPANMLCGRCPETVPEGMEKICEPVVQG